MASWDVVKSSLRKLLPSLDLQSATERIIIETLEKQMGQSLTDHRSLIREEIDDFLVNMEEDEEFEDKPTSAPAPKPTSAPAAVPKVGAKRTATASAKQTPAAKRVAAVKEDSSLAGSTASPLEPNMWEISKSGERRIKVDTYQGKVMVSIREFYSDKDGVMKPGSKGLSMPIDQYRALLSGVDAINAAVENGGQEGFVVDLAKMRKVTVEKYKSTLQVGLREYYEKGGKTLPGKKGISLPEDQWRKIAELLPEVTAAVEAMTDGKPLLAKPATPAPALALESGPSEETKAPTPNALALSEGSGGGDSNVVELSNNRRASVEVYKNKPLVSVREFYQDSAGEWKPTQKGLSMNDAQWGVFMDNASDINDAVAEEGKAGLMVELSSTRRVTVEQFKGGTVISMREFYQKDDKMLPGKKGITLTLPQWQTLYSNLDKLQTLFAASSSA
mmetsp:Transcript_11584/g.19747  ORF Transcript_11584/g.19747 Transcript_11584/m.19747 type:complete len:446 (-) Transcript_11584:67-1404(-)|eukprot:CAMPEP_0198212124 /NCGR_PEP_ID=MMETSP1445-20131203/25532_1 /TAXON_ID=36898 /ORGANISM="Pyramimonas sp., Strain CCMP2087" /LENGTH=445 /DNA_ID=CAMNT_0043886509 /DNA_START=127 /DNA_END=1464 /DNA_ORIENTATION=+